MDLGGAARLGLEAMLAPDTSVRFVTMEIKDTRSGSIPGNEPDSILMLAVYLMAREMIQQWEEEVHIFRDMAAPQQLSLVFKCEWDEGNQLENWLNTEFLPILTDVLKVQVLMGIGNRVSGVAEWKRGYLTSRPRLLKQHGSHETIQRVITFVLEHYADENISLSQMASRFHLHVTYLSELFKKTTGKNYIDFITEVRIEKAKVLMADPLLKVFDIAERVGFSNPNYFSQVFKKITGLSPIDYRDQHYRY